MENGAVLIGARRDSLQRKPSSPHGGTRRRETVRRARIVDLGWLDDQSVGTLFLPAITIAELTDRVSALQSSRLCAFGYSQHDPYFWEWYPSGDCRLCQTNALCPVK